MNTDDRFDLEIAIMSAWQTEDDIKLLAERYSSEMSTDDVLNTLVGISQLHHMRCEKLFEIFERMLKNLHEENLPQTKKKKNTVV